MCMIRDENKNDWSLSWLNMMSRFGKKYLADFKQI